MIFLKYGILAGDLCVINLAFLIVSGGSSACSQNECKCRVNAWRVPIQGQRCLIIHA